MTDTKNIDSMVKANRNLVFYMAKKFPMVSREDAIQAGMMGLTEACQRYDAAKGKFGAFACTWIKCRIMELAMIDRPVNVVRTREGRKIFGRLSKARARILARGETLTDETLAIEIGVTVESIREIVPLLDSQPMSLDVQIGEDGGETMGDRLESGAPFADDHLDSMRRIERVRAMFAEYASKANEREAAVLTLHLTADDPMTLDELGERFGCTKQRMGQIANKVRKDLAAMAVA